MPTRDLLFPNGRGDVLTGRLDLPIAAPPRACALLAHCFTCSEDLRSARRLTDELARRGIATLRFDFTGLDRSDAAFEYTTFTTHLDDLVAAAAALEQECGRGPSILIGHSLGGTAVLHAAPRIPTSRAVATIGAPASPAHVRQLFEGELHALRAEGSAKVDIGGRPFHIGASFIRSVQETESATVVRDLRRALLILHSPVDTVVAVENAAALYQAAMHPKSFVSLDGADHLLGEEADARYAASMIATWAERYVEVDEGTLDALGHDVVSEIGESGYTTRVGSGRHGLLADEPRSVGGADEGPSPYALLLSSLGACTAMTLRMYADRKDWPLLGARVRLTHTRQHAVDAEDVETKAGGIDVIDREIELIGPLDDEQLNRLMQIADKCPVHKTLHAEVKVNSMLRG